MTLTQIAELCSLVASANGCVNGTIEGLCSQADIARSEWCEYCLLGEAAQHLERSDDDISALRERLAVSEGKVERLANEPAEQPSAAPPAAGSEPPDEEMVPHAFTSRTPYEPGDDRDIWCKECEYHRDHLIHSPTPAPPASAQKLSDNPLTAQLLDLITLMPDSQTQEVVDYIQQLREIRANRRRPSGARITGGEMTRDCTCTGFCKGRDGLSARYTCSLDGKPGKVGSGTVSTQRSELLNGQERSDKEHSQSERVEHRTTETQARQQIVNVVRGLAGPLNQWELSDLTKAIDALAAAVRADRTTETVETK